MNTSQQEHERYQHVIESIDQLPSLPAIVTRLIQVVNSPDSSAEDAASLIERDPALTSKMLRLANSAFYGIPRTISSVSSAVVILGFNTIKSLVLSASVIKIFPTAGAPTFDRSRFWRHSIVTAMAARALVKSVLQVKLIDPESAFCAGILHDIGKLVFEQYVHDDYQTTCQVARDKDIPLHRAERHVMGTDHAGIGKLLAERWALPVELEHSIVSHHDLKVTGPTADVVAAVHLANGIAHELGTSLWDGERTEETLAQALSMLRMTPEGYQNVRARVEEEMNKSDEFFSIINAG